MKNPHWCRCDTTTIDYSQILEGHLTCRECDRVWKFVPNVGWSPFPLTKRAPSG